LCIIGWLKKLTIFKVVIFELVQTYLIRFLVGRRYGDNPMIFEAKKQFSSKYRKLFLSQRYLSI
tara:strand:+ start:172 stop:363 length:192 start_codon:yes stop_codon:yes gene_type:complete